MPGVVCAAFSLLLAAAFASPAAAQTSSKLVGNTGETTNFESDVGVPRAQGFTTGSNADGYTVTRVDVTVTNIVAGSGVDLQIYSSKQANCPTQTPPCHDSSLGTLAYDATASTSSLARFTSSGIALAASTTYFVVWRSDSASTSQKYHRTNSDAEDSDTLTGWSIANGSFWHNRTSWGTSATSLKMDVYGHAGAASTSPTVTITGGSAVTEGTAAEFTVTASAAPTADLTVNLTVSESAGSDYVAASDEGAQTVTITASSTTATYSVATEQDTVNEPNGTVTVAVASGTGYTVGTAGSANVTVNDNDRAAISGAAITSSPAFGDTYRRRENVEVTVTWDEDVTWDLSAANARMRVRLDIGGATRTADLVTDGATSGTARSLTFRYAVVSGDTDGDGLAVTPTAGGDLVILASGATLQGSDSRAARRKHAGLAADASHKVDGSVVTRAPSAPAAPTVSAASSTSLSVSWSAPSNLGSATAITDYDLRYFAGTADHADAADWIREGDTNGPPDPGSNTTATITGLTASTAYRVQVRAQGDLESPWSASGSGTTSMQENRAPVFTATENNEATDDINAVSRTLVSIGTDRDGFSDPDGDTLTFTATLSREDTHDATGFTDHSDHLTAPRRVYFRAKGECELANLDPPLSGPPTAAPRVTYTLTASDPSGATAQITREFILSGYAGLDGMSGVLCPTLTGAAVNAGTLTLTYEGLSDLAPSDLQGSEFTVTVAGTAVALAPTNPVTIGTPVTSGGRDTTTVTLKLAAPVAPGAAVTVSHTPGASPSTVGFTDETVTNNTAAPPALSGATVTNGRTVTLTFDKALATPGAQELRELRWAFSADGLYNDGVRLRNVVPSQVAVSGTTVTLTFGGLEALPGRDVTVTYRDSIAEEVGVSLQDGSGNRVTQFTQTLTRAASGAIPPVLSASRVAGTALTLTFDRALDASSAPAGRRFRVTHRAGDWHGETVFVSGTGTASVSGSPGRASRCTTARRSTPPARRRRRATSR